MTPEKLESMTSRLHANPDTAPVTQEEINLMDEFFDAYAAGTLCPMCHHIPAAPVFTCPACGDTWTAAEYR